MNTLKISDKLTISNTRGIIRNITVSREFEIRCLHFKKYITISHKVFKLSNDIRSRVSKKKKKNRKGLVNYLYIFLFLFLFFFFKKKTGAMYQNVHFFFLTVNMQRQLLTTQYVIII
jgi:dolichol kinase